MGSVVEPFGEGVGAGAGGRAEFGGGPSRGGQPDDPIPGVLPGRSSRPEGAGLTCPCRGGQRGQEVPATDQVPDGAVLAEVQPGGPYRVQQRVRVGVAVATAAAPFGERQDPGFGGQDLHGGVPGVRGSGSDAPDRLPDRDGFREVQRGVGEGLDPGQHLRSGQATGG